jgi:diguanylate cyclase
MTNATYEFSTPAPATHAKIMIVDDEPIVVKVIGLHLRKAGYNNLVSTSDSASAMEMIRACRPDLLLLDLTMPGVSGIEILAAILTDRSLSDLRVIVVTASCDDQVKALARELGAKAILSKPIDDVDMIWRIREALA